MEQQKKNRFFPLLAVMVIVLATADYAGASSKKRKTYKPYEWNEIHNPAVYNPSLAFKHLGPNSFLGNTASQYLGYSSCVQGELIREYHQSGEVSPSGARSGADRCRPNK